MNHRCSAYRHSLQWGRVLTNAETASTETPVSYSHSLQWGRVLTNAETSSTHNPSIDSASMGPRSHERGNPPGRLEVVAGQSKRFNGAAFSRTRKRREQEVERVAWNASMGPRSHERGNCLVGRAKLHDALASMGPRSHERGNCRRSPLAVILASASMGPRSHERGNTRWGSMHSVRSALQWGRVLTNAETRNCENVRADRVDASMGPRSHERGNRPCP